MPKFTFHLPVHDHDEIIVEVPEGQDETDAAEILRYWISYNEHKDKVTVGDSNIDDGDRYYSADVYDCPCFNEEGIQLD